MTRWFRALLNPLKLRRSVTSAPWSSSRQTRRLQVEALEDRSVPAAIADPVGDFLPTYTGPQDPGLDVTAHETVYLEDQGRVVFYGRMAGPIAPTQAIGGVYLVGLDRGPGTPRFLNSPAAPPVIGPHVLFDSVVRINPNGTGLFNNLVAGVSTPLDSADISISGNEFTASVPLSLLTPAATRPPQEWTYNLWPRNGVGRNVQVSDLAPDDGNSPVQTIAPARVASVVLNDGSAQRSMVNSVTVTFDGPVTLDTGAFTLNRVDGGPVELNVAASVVNGQTVAVLTFAGTDVIGGSLTDGSYTLTVQADQVHDRWGRELDGDGNGAAGGDRVDSFFRLFGDSDGDGDVDRLDRDRFRSAFKSMAGEVNYLWYFDFDGDGDVDGRDNGQFNRRFGQS
jgi:hypothetical protein